MAKFFTAVSRGIAAMSAGPKGELFHVVERPVRCPHCSGDRFIEGRAQLNTAGMTFLNLDWANASAATLACTTCGHILWFVGDPKADDE